MADTAVKENLGPDTAVKENLGPDTAVKENLGPDTAVEEHPGTEKKIIAKRTRHNRNKKLFYIPKRNFRNLVREIAQKQKTEVDLSWFSQAFDALQTDAEEFLTEKFINAGKICELVETKTLQLKHFLKSNQFQFQLVEYRPVN